MPYDWVLKEETQEIPTQKGKLINIRGLLSRYNRLFFDPAKALSTASLFGKLDVFSLKILKSTVLVLENARIHTAYKIKERLEIWQNRGLFIFYLPPNSHQFNIIERLWKELKAWWLNPRDYTIS